MGIINWIAIYKTFLVVQKWLTNNFLINVYIVSLTKSGLVMIKFMFPRRLYRVFTRSVIPEYSKKSFHPNQYYFKYHAHNHICNEYTTQ